MGLTSAYSLAGQKNTKILVAIAKCFPNRVIHFTLSILPYTIASNEVV